MLCAAWLHVVACRSVACSACRATAAEVRRAAAAVEVLHVAMPIAAVKHRHLGIAATPVARRPPAARQRRGRAPFVEDVVAPMPKGLVASAVGDKGGLVRDDPACACFSAAVHSGFIAEARASRGPKRGLPAGAERREARRSSRR